MTNINFRFRKGAGSNLDIIFGTVTLKPTLAHSRGTSMVLPAPSTWDIVNGEVTATNVQPTPEPVDGVLEWGYEVTVKDRHGKSYSFLVGVPDSTSDVEFVSLPRYFETKPPLFGQGPKGDAGEAATVTVGTVTKGTEANVTNSGTSSNAILDFVLPKGDKGDRGDGVPTGGTALQYIRKDSTGTTTEWTTLNKSSVGLGNVDNTADSNKPVSSPQKTYIDQSDTLPYRSKLASDPASDYPIGVSVFAGDIRDGWPSLEPSITGVNVVTFRTQSPSSPSGTVQWLYPTKDTSVPPLWRTSSNDTSFSWGEFQGISTQKEAVEVRETFDEFDRGDNRSFTCKRVPATSNIPEHIITSISNVQHTKRSTQHPPATGEAKQYYDPSELDTLTTYYERTKANVIINGSAWWQESGRRVGLTIHDGQLIQDWEPLPQTSWGVEALVFYRDGTIRIEDRSTSGAQLISNGAWNSICFGKAAIRNGVDQGLASSSQYAGITGRQSIGVANNGDLVILTFPGQTGVWGATIQQVLSVASTLNLKDLYMNDGGGSSQLLVNGQYVVPSSDAGGERAVPDALCITATPASSIPWGTGWTPLVLSSDDGSYTPTPVTGDYNDCRIRVGLDGVKEVVLRIGISGVPSGRRAFTIPAGIRPTKFKTGLVGSNAGAFVLVNMGTDGNATVFGASLDPSKVIRGEIRYILG